MSRFKLVSHTKVLNLLIGLSNSKAIGLDKISGKILKIAAPTIALSLTVYLIMLSLQAVFHVNGKRLGYYHFTKRVHEISQKIIRQSQFYLQ